MKTKTQDGNLAELFCREWLQGMEGVFAEALGCAWIATVNSEAERIQRQDDFWVHFEVEPGAGRLALRLQRSGATEIARMLLGVGTADDMREQDVHDAIQELLRQVAGRVSLVMQEHVPDFHLKFADTLPPAAMGAKSGQSVCLSSESGNRLSMEVVADLQLSAPSVGAEPVQSRTKTCEESNLALLMDVELKLTLRFGQKAMTLQEVLQLNSGAVVELDKQVQEPVDLLLAGKVIARGEVVVVDGNYGLRVTELAAPGNEAVARGLSWKS